MVLTFPVHVTTCRQDSGSKHCSQHWFEETPVIQPCQQPVSAACSITVSSRASTACASQDCSFSLHLAALRASSQPTHKQSAAAPGPLSGSSAQRGTAQALQVPRKNARAGLRTTHTGVEREPWRSGSKEVPAASAARHAQPAAPVSTKEGAKPVSPRGLQRAQLVEKYKTEAAARKQAHTMATIERTASVAALLQHAASLQAPSSKAHLTTNAGKQDAAPASLSKTAG